MPHQEALTVVVRVDPARVSSLQQVLRAMQRDPAHNDSLPFGAVESCHFGRLVFLPATSDLAGRPVEPQLVMITDCDGATRDHLNDLVTASGSGIDAVFGHCRGYPRSPASRDQRLKFLRRHMVRTPANYVHRPGRTVRQIRGEAELHRALQTFVSTAAFDGLSALDVRERVRGFVRSQSALAWALTAPEGIRRTRRVLDALDLVARPLGLVAFGPIVLPAALLVLALVRLQEMRDRPEPIRPSPEHVAQLAELEDFVAHNGFTAGGFVKPGWVRRLVISTVLPLIGFGTRHLFTRDSLAGVKSIHFARWIPLDGGKRVVFASNYDGSLESYNNDFIDLVAWGLNLVFSNGQGYPRTRWLVLDGARYEQDFKDFLRRHQVPTPVWYSAYPHLTALNVERNAKLRAGLRGTMTESEAQQWLRLL